VGQIIGEVLKQLDAERCTMRQRGALGTVAADVSAPVCLCGRMSLFSLFARTYFSVSVSVCAPLVIVKASSGPRYVVGCRRKIDAKKLTNGTRVALDMTTLTIMRTVRPLCLYVRAHVRRRQLTRRRRYRRRWCVGVWPVVQLPREVDPLVYNMSVEAPGDVSYSAVGGLGEQIREVREVIELPLLNPELFLRVGISPPKGVLLYGPPGTGKTLLARAIAANVDANFLKVVASGIVDKYIGESARLIREMFGACVSATLCASVCV
jgi:26S proteasome regulatory subunit T4